jgi:hypothetical protein
VNDVFHTFDSSDLGYIPNAIYGILTSENFAIQEQLKVETSAGHKTSGAFLLLISLHFKFMKFHEKWDASVWNVALHVLEDTQYSASVSRQQI